MKVTFRQIGGFVPMALGCSLDSADLPPADAARLRSLVEGSGFWSLGDARLPRAADVPTIWIDVDDDGRTHGVELSLIRVPDEVGPLVQFLRERSRNILDELRGQGQR